MADNILYLNISLVSSKFLFEVWLFDKGGVDDKIAMIAVCCWCLLFSIGS